MGRFVDSLIAYRILRMLVTPFAETDAYRLGIVNEKGKELKKMRNLNSVEERDAYTILHRMIFRIKKIIEKVPVENKRLVSFAAALSLIKEHYHNNKEPVDLELQYVDRLRTDLNEEINFIQQSSSKIFTFKQFVEEAPANNAAATPGIAGFTPDTLGVPKGKQPKISRRKPYVERIA